MRSLRRPGDRRVFAWNLAKRSLDRELIRIQEMAKVRLPCRESHEHTASCLTYGFHSFRYGFAQLNLGRLSRDELQEQMGHRFATTTDLYINYAKRQKREKVDVFKPTSLRRPG